MELTRRSAIVVTALGFFLVGLLIGWLVIGWWAWPIQYYDADPFDLRAEHKVQWVTMAADSYALTNDLEQARGRMSGWSEEELGTILSDLTTQYMQQGRGAEAQRVTTLANDLGVNIAAVPAGEAAAAAEPAGERSFLSSLFAICGVLIVVVLVIAGGAAGWSYLQRRRGTERRPAGGIADEVEPTPHAMVARAAPDTLGAFSTMYNIGDDSYDDCFPIETTAGEFLGECGVGISELLREGPPSQVTAFEVWLFDKSDIRTVTKVLMSEYAYNNPDLRDRLAPKGEAVLIEPGKSVMLETNTLRLQADIREMIYGDEKDHDRYFTKLRMDMAVVSRVADA